MRSQVVQPWSRQKEMRHALAWERCRKVMLAPGGPEEYCDGIANVFFRYGIEARIRDAACGTGYSTLPLETKITESSYSDGSEAMVECFNRNARKGGWGSRAFLMHWQDFRRMPGTAKAILLLGNSLPYAGSWGKDVGFDGFAARAKAAVLDALAALHEKIKKGGALLFDLYRDSEGTGKRFFGEVGEPPVQLFWEIARDSGKKMRKWILTENFDSGFRRVFELHSLLLSSSEWISVAKTAGFKCVEKLPSNLQLEQGHYTTFIAFKR